VKRVARQLLTKLRGTFTVNCREDGTRAPVSGSSSRTLWTRACPEPSHHEVVVRATWTR
jgi:hypothetical protein